MEMDYRELCVELFGTDNVEELRNIADGIKQKNQRNAGRKKKFTDEEVAQMKQLRNGGISINEIAERYGTSRQVIGRYLTAKRNNGCTMRMTYMYKQHPCTVIDLDFLNQKVYIQNKTNDILHRAFGIVETPTWDDLDEFLRERCFPESRGNRKQILRELGLTEYDPLQIVEKTKGRTADDDMWLKFRYFDRGAIGNAHN
jgi:transcriptional regulator with XRE-family HTH domain